ncbi:unnamed protein product [Onchocerca flexuosa]|uniref:DB module n=1 Tax=Onchocerca flexuosa TaxID=387005 RepID=A0A183GXR9_9BILA|nr:unnamed protein product [Onchocerca flexuosa]
MIFVWIIHFMISAKFQCEAAKTRDRCDIMHQKHCCNPFIYNNCFHKCHKWAALNCFQDRAQYDQVVTTKDLINVKVPFVPVINHKSGRNEVSDKAKGTSINEECGTFNAEFAPCVQKEIADQIFHDCCKLYVEPECHELCQYETNRDVAQSLLLEIFRKKKCPVDNISAVLHCASQNRDNRLCCRKFGLISPELGFSRRCLQMCDPYRFGITVLREYDFVCLNDWDIIMYCHHGGLRY